MRPQQAGFTLIELLIAIAVAAVIALLSYKSIDSAVRITQAYTQQTDEVAQLQRAVWWLEQDIMQMAPRPVLDELGSVMPAMILQSDRFEFTRIALYPTPHASGGLIRVAYVLEDQQLWRWVWRVLDRAPDSEPHKTLLLTQVNQFEIRLLDQKREWQNNWPVELVTTDQLTQLPGLVELNLNLEHVGDIRRLLLGVDGWQK